MVSLFGCLHPAAPYALKSSVPAFCLPYHISMYVELMAFLPAVLTALENLTLPYGCLGPWLSGRFCLLLSLVDGPPAHTEARSPQAQPGRPTSINASVAGDAGRWTVQHQTLFQDTQTLQRIELLEGVLTGGAVDRRPAAIASLYSLRHSSILPAADRSRAVCLKQGQVGAPCQLRPHAPQAAAARLLPHRMRQQLAGQSR